MSASGYRWRDNITQARALKTENYVHPDYIKTQNIEVRHVSDCYSDWGIFDVTMNHFHEIKLASDTAHPFQSRKSIQLHFFNWYKKNVPLRGHWTPGDSGQINCSPGDCRTEAGRPLT